MAQGQLFDSGVLIAYLRGVQGAGPVLEAAVLAGAAHCSVLSRVEIEGGMRSAERGRIARMFSALILQPVSAEIAAEAGRALREDRRSHQGVGLVDYVIGATATVLGLELLTLNVRHFPALPDLAPAFR